MKRLAWLWVASLIVVGLVTAVFTHAQTPGSDPKILSGSDIGFRIDGRDMSGHPTGTFMVRVNGKWTEARATLGPRRTTN
jgi:hypothetical protein